MCLIKAKIAQKRCSKVESFFKERMLQSESCAKMSKLVESVVVPQVQIET